MDGDVGVRGWRGVLGSKARYALASPASAESAATKVGGTACNRKRVTVDPRCRQLRDRRQAAAALAVKRLSLADARRRRGSSMCTLPMAAAMIAAHYAAARASGNTVFRLPHWPTRLDRGSFKHYLGRI
jgi:hypothetical protein